MATQNNRSDEKECIMHMNRMNATKFVPVTQLTTNKHLLIPPPWATLTSSVHSIN